MPKIFFPSLKPRFINSDKVIEDLRTIALKIAGKNNNVEQIYLFGSYAQGNAGVHSDADILVILSEDNRVMLDRLDEFIIEFSEGPVPVDVLVYAREELARALTEGNHFLKRAVSGIALYDKEK